jgi:cytochrome c5
MLRTLLPAVFAAGTVFAAVCAYAESKFSLKSVSVNLPAGDRLFPEGPGADVVNNNCLACHSAGMVLNQPALSKAQWEAEVNKMRTFYKAPVDPKDVDAIVSYLVSLNREK